MEIALSGTLANSTEVTLEELYDFFLDENPEIEIYERKTTPGQVYAASIDWHIIWSIGVDLVEISAIFWAAYEKLIKPKKKSNSNGGICINISQPKNREFQYSFWIGNEIQSEKDLKESITIFLNENGVDLESNMAKVKLIRDETNWKKIKKKPKKNN